MMPVISKIQIQIAAVIIFITWLYFWHYAPMEELEEKKKEVKTLRVEKEKENFESRHKAIKETISKKKEETHEEVNLTIGIHTTNFK